MTSNRLNLDFKLETKAERVEYVTKYLEAIRFKPTQTELDTIAKYILWGKSPETGLNGRQEGLELETRRKTWDTQHVESLDALLESPAFSETMLRAPHDPPTKITREVFSRSATRAHAPDYILPSFELLWREIDQTELLINLYDCAIGKRKMPPRDALLSKFSEAEIQSLKNSAATLSSYSYLKLKHRLVELRREQYNLRDEYKPQILSNLTPNYNLDEGPVFESDIQVLPIGLPFHDSLYNKIFNADRFPAPKDFSHAELVEISRLLWRPKTPNSLYFDFCDVSHLYALYGMWELLEEQDSPTLRPLLRAASVYRTLANLDPILNEILNCKIQKKSNEDIVELLLEKYQKSYRPNYISTLYCKKCLGGIAEAARYHREVLENIFFPENFKTCKDCGGVFLLNEKNFMRRHRASDGFSPRCKRCEKIMRDSKKMR